MKNLLAMMLCLMVVTGANSQHLTGSQLLEKTLAYHDPQDNWNKLKATVYYDEHREDNTIRKSVVHFDNQEDKFKMERTDDKFVITRGTVGDSCYVLVNGVSEFDAKLDETYNLDCERSFLYRNYYLYMQGLPMKLQDPGAIIHPEVQSEQFMGKSYLKMKVTYREDVGSDVWYFFVNPDTYAVEAYQFYHDEAKGDGEYITLEGEMEVAGMKWPKMRHWYTNQEQKYLGKDVIVKINRR